MTTSAPRTRLVDALSGEIGSPVLGILATADHICEGLSEVERLKRDNAKLREQCDALLSSPYAELHCRIAELEAELKGVDRG